MPKILIDPELQGKDLFKFLRENRKALENQKKSMIKHTEAIAYKGAALGTQVEYAQKDGAFKAVTGDEVPVDATSLKVKVVANTSMFCDSAMDVLLRDSASKSMKERKGKIPHIHDHVHQTDAEIGDVLSIYYQDLPLTELGWDGPGTGQGLVFETRVRKDYNPVIFEKYRTGRVKFHSIGLQYIQLFLAINDEEDPKEKDFFDKYINDIINKDYVLEKGYFWVVPEYRLLENSCVLLAANDLTPTLEVSKHHSTEQQPPVSTDAQPHTGKMISFEELMQTRFII